MKRAVWVVWTVLALAGCGTQSGVSESQDQANQEQRAHAVLARWDAALAAAGNAAVYAPIGEVIGEIGDWEPTVADNNKTALYYGQIGAVSDLPAPPQATGTIVWADGHTREAKLVSAGQALTNLTSGKRQDCKGCTPIEIVSARLSTAQVKTSRGMASVPAWEYTLRDTSVKITYPALEASVALIVSPLPWDGPNPAPATLVEAATVSADGLTLTAQFNGAKFASDKRCGADYTARTIESDNAVALLVFEHPYVPAGPCTAIGAPRTATATLATPLGERTVLEVREGQPVPTTAG